MRQRNVDLEHRSLFRLGAQADRTVEQLGEPVDDREPKTKPLCPVALDISELNELMEDFMLSLQRDAASGIPHLDAEVIPATTAHEDASTIGIADGIGNKVPEDALKEEWVSADDHRAIDGNQPQTLGFGLREMVTANTLQQGPDRKVFTLRLDNAGVETGDVEQRIEKAVHGGDRTANLPDEPPHLVVHWVALQGPHEQSQGVNRLPQIVTRSGDELRFGDIGLVRGLLLSAQLADQALVLKGEAGVEDEISVEAQRHLNA